MMDPSVIVAEAIWNSSSSISSSSTTTLVSIETSSSNDSACVPAGEMHRQVAVGELYVQIAFGIAYTVIWFLGVFSNILTLIVAFSIITGRGPAARVLSAQTEIGGPRSAAPNGDAADGAPPPPQRRRPAAAGGGKPSFTVRTVFVGSLATSDLLTVLTSLPVTAVNLFTDEWPFPAFVCPSVGFLQAFSIFQSSFTFTSIAVDRFVLILFSDGPQWAFTYRTARLVVGCTALLAFTLASPMFAFVSVVPMPPMCGEFCVETWPDWASSLINQRTYGLFVLTLQYGLPTVVTTVCYLTISRYLKRCHVVRQEKLHVQSKSERRSEDRRRRANGMMICMVCVFVAFWTPFNALNLLRDFGLFDKLFDWSMFGILYAFAHLIAMTTVVFNPVIYAFYNRSIRDAMLALLRGGGQRYEAMVRSRRAGGSTDQTRLGVGQENGGGGSLQERKRSSMIALTPLENGGRMSR